MNEVTGKHEETCVRNGLLNKISPVDASSSRRAF